MVGMRDRLSFGGIDVNNPGVGPTMGSVAFQGSQGGVTADEAGKAGGNPLAVWIGLAGLLVLFHFVRQQSSHLQQNVLGINIFNLLVVTIVAIVGITLFKVVFTKFPVPGVSPLVQAV